MEKNILENDVSYLVKLASFVFISAAEIYNTRF